MPVDQLHVSGYRSIRDLHLELGRLTVIVGPNGCGKTNLYRSMFLVSAAANGNLARTLADEGGMPSVLWAGPRTKGPLRMSIGIELEDLAYEISCGLVPPVPGERGLFSLDPEVKEEHIWAIEKRRRLVLLERKDRSAFLRDANGDRVSFPASLWAGESTLAQLQEPHRFPVLSQFKSEFLSWRFYHHFRTDLDAPVRQPQIGIRTPVLSHDGRDLAAALQTIIEIGDGRALQQGVDLAFPGSSINVEAPHGRFSLYRQMPGIARPLDSTELSDGTLRYLCLLAVWLSPRPPTLLALNEPETSLHPDLIEPVAQLLASAATRTQLLVTTHSEELAAFLQKLSGGAKRISLEKIEGETRVTKVPEPEAEDQAANKGTTG
jgi:predicted ATPase